jgi:hypothetical protein
MKCPKCGWPMTLAGTKKVLAKLLTSFRCTNPHCKRELTQISSAN